MHSEEATDHRSAAMELLDLVDRGNGVSERDRDRLCTTAVLNHMANEMPESWLRTRLVAGACGLTGSRTQPWLLIPSRRESASRLLMHMSDGTDLGRVMRRALDVQPAHPDAWERLGASLRSGDFGDATELRDEMQRFVSCDARELVRRKMNRKQLAHIPEVRVRVMVKGAEKLQRRLRRLLESHPKSKLEAPPEETAIKLSRQMTKSMTESMKEQTTRTRSALIVLLAVVGVVVALGLAAATIVWLRRRREVIGPREGDVKTVQEKAT